MSDTLLLEKLLSEVSDVQSSMNDMNREIGVQGERFTQLDKKVDIIFDKLDEGPDGNDDVGAVVGLVKRHPLVSVIIGFILMSVLSGTMSTAAVSQLIADQITEAVAKPGG